ncbi:glucokinase [Wenzhouxiangella sp. AB-CW3]|uniref:glucokinase n=1 Tax=Wenzhouxiangella sp. AB-CW3 TaxID=2771012 RepID=UPI00168C0148|nr:glucokinase [Wenzhouxiangella sp. AB-CW3]QOC23026.1 glucokinase [Wenzhouxiangella sp. AB-CW3]
MLEPVLVGDIGGTNARFALAEPNEQRPILRDIARLPTADFASLQQAASHYLSGVGVRPEQAALAVASPVRGDDIRLTNRAWSFNRLELARTLDFSDLQVLNDFGATARATPALEPGEFEWLNGPDRQRLQTPISVIGPGTGLGMALLVDCPAHQWRVIETEGGHVSYAPLGSEEEQIHQWLAARHGRVSVERALSGSGLSKIHAALAGVPPAKTELSDQQLRDPADVVQAALDGEERTARAALARFCAILGSVAGDAALIHGAATLAIAGGIVPRFIPFLKSSAFRERFLDKGRFAAHLEQVQIIVVTHPEPGLLGAALSMLSPEHSEHSET